MTLIRIILMFFEKFEQTISKHHKQTDCCFVFEAHLYHIRTETLHHMLLAEITKK